MTTFTDRDPRSGPMPDPTPPSATRRDDDATAGTPATGPAATATAPDDLVWCRGCNQGKPRAERVGFRCKQCAEKAAKSTSRWLFDAAGNVISKGKQKCK